MSRWTRDYATGITICAVCGEEKNGRTDCCPTAPHISFAEFKEKYFSYDTGIPNAIAREFHEDYLNSNYASLDDYMKATTEAE